jgi:hypothetical protein
MAGGELRSTPPILTVMPAKAGIPLLVQYALTQSWIPAFAGMTA